MLRTSVRQLLAALDYLHKEAHVIHTAELHYLLPLTDNITADCNTDLQSNNILMGIDDESVLFEYEKDEFEHQVPQKVVGDRMIYLSRPLLLVFGPPVLCDLGEAPLGHEEYQDDIIPDVYRAPEVILSMKWSYKVDIWNVAMVVRLLSNIHFHSFFSTPETDGVVSVQR